MKEIIQFPKRQEPIDNDGKRATGKGVPYKEIFTTREVNRLVFIRKVSQEDIQQVKKHE